MELTKNWRLKSVRSDSLLYNKIDDRPNDRCVLCVRVSQTLTQIVLILSSLSFFSSRVAVRNALKEFNPHLVAISGEFRIKILFTLFFYRKFAQIVSNV